MYDLAGFSALQVFTVTVHRCRRKLGTVRPFYPGISQQFLNAVSFASAAWQEADSLAAKTRLSHTSVICRIPQEGVEKLDFG